MRLQMEAIEAAGGQIILMASRAFPAMGAGADTYARVYGRLLDQAAEPVILHWLGDMFDPALAGYWGIDRRRKGLRRGAGDYSRPIPAKVDGIKISLLDQAHEEAFRARLPEGVRLYTGDDFNYADLIAGDGKHYSHALLGIFAAIAPAASQALEALARGDMATYHALLAPTVPLVARDLQGADPVLQGGHRFHGLAERLRKAISSCRAGFQSSRDITHYAEVFRLADQARSAARARSGGGADATLLRLHGIE